MRDFVGTVADAGCEVFIVHARNAMLKGLSARRRTARCRRCEYEYAYRLKRDFPQLEIVINGGIKTRREVADAPAARRRRDARPRGVPQSVSCWPASTRAFTARRRAVATREEIEAGLIDYARSRACARHLSGRDHAACARAVSRRSGGTRLASRAVGQQAAGDAAISPFSTRRARHLREAVECRRLFESIRAGARQTGIFIRIISLLDRQASSW